MKKNGLIKGLLLSAIVLSGIHGHAYFAEENQSAPSESDTQLSNDTVLSSEQDEAVVSNDTLASESTEAMTDETSTTVDNEPVDSVQSVLATEEQPAVVSGVYGTVPWTWDEETGTLVFGEGEFPSTEQGNNTVAWIKYYTKHIKFTKPIIANKDSSFLFANLRILETIEGASLLDTSNVEDMSSMFYDTLSLSHLDIGGWDTGNVTNMSTMFSSSSRKNCGITELDLSRWNTSSVTDISGMFYKTIHLTKLDVSGWDTSNVTTMSGLFNETTALTELDINSWDTSKVKNMDGIFYGAGLVELDVNSWNTSSVTGMNGMFASTSLTELDVSNWDTSSVTSMSNMFSGTKLTKLNLNSLDTSSVTNMSSMFRSTSLTELHINDWDTTNVTTMQGMFEASKSLTKLNLNDWDTSNVIKMSRMFSDASSLTVIEINRWNTGSVTDMSYMFQGTIALENLDVSSWNTENLSGVSYMFNNASSLVKLDVSRWDTKKLWSMECMFTNASSLIKLDVSNWDVGNVTNMRYLFSNVKSLAELDVSKWNTENVTTTCAMFNNMASLTKIDVSNWDTSKLVDIGYMFRKASKLTEIDVKNWNTSSLIMTGSAFAYTDSLTELDITNWDMSRMRVDSYMFADANSLDTLHLGEKMKIRYSELPEKSDDVYTGRWKRVSSDSEVIFESSLDLCTNYRPAQVGKYVREKYTDNVTGIELKPDTLDLTVSEEAALQAKVIPEAAINKTVTFTTSDAFIASVSPEGVVKGLQPGTAVITATTEDGGFQATSTVTVYAQSNLLLDTFYLGIDDYVTGEIDPSLGGKKVQLWVNDELITTSTIFSDGSFELDTEGMITKKMDKVFVAALDRKNAEIDRAKVKLEEKAYSLSADPYTLFEDFIVTGQTDYFHTHVVLLINGDEIERKALASNRKFSFNVTDLIEYDDDEVEVVGYRYDTEITRTAVTIQAPNLNMTLAAYKIDDPFVTGKVTNKIAENVCLYVNRRRQQTVKVAEDGTFSLLGIAITSVSDKVEVAVLNDAGVEIQRFSVVVLM